MLGWMNGDGRIWTGWQRHIAECLLAGAFLPSLQQKLAGRKHGTVWSNERSSFE